MRTANVVVTEDHGECGAVVWWELSGPIDRAKLETEWTQSGLDSTLLPPEVSPEVALHRAVHDVRQRGQLVRRLPDRSGWALVDESAVGDTDLAWQTAFKVRLNPLGHLLVEPAGHHMEASAAAAFDRFATEVKTTDTSTWLVRLAVHVGAVQLRRGGGVYFVPRTTLPTWRSIVGAIERSSAHAMWRVPAMRTEEAVASVLAAVTAEAQDEAVKFEAVLIEGTMGAVGLSNRVDAAERMKEKLARYEELLGVGLDGMRDKLESLRASLAAAVLVAQAEQEAA
jgi:hypothetical protein